MANIGSLVADLSVNSAAFTAGLQKANQTLNTQTAIMNRTLGTLQNGFKGLQSTVGGLAGAVAAFAAGNAVVNFGKDAVAAFNDAEESANRLSSALESTKRFSDSAMNQIAANATAISRATKEEDDAIISASATFANFAKKLSSSEIASAQKGIVGLATVMKVDLDTAAKQLGKTVSGASNTIGRSGIEIGKTKDQSERLSQALGKLNGFYKTAEGLAETNKGRAEQLKNEWGNVMETLGQTITVGANVGGMFKTLTARVIDLDSFLKRHQATIAKVMQIAIEGGKAVYYAISSTVQLVAASITNNVSTALNAINFLVAGSMRGLNNVIKLVNMVSPNKLGTLSEKGIANPFESATKSLMKGSWNDARNVGRSFGKMFAPTSFKFSMGGGLSLSDRMDDEGSSSGGGGKKKKEAKDKALDKLKSEADAIRERNRTIFEIEKEGMAKLKLLRSKNLVDMETYKRESARLNKELMDAIKIPTEEIHAATDKMLSPFRELMEEMEGSVKTSDAFNDKLSNSKSLLESIKTPLQEYQEKIQSYADLLREGFIPNQEAFNSLVAKAKEAFISTQEESKNATDRYQLLSGALSNVGSKIEDVFVTAVTKGKFSFKDFAMSIIEDLTRLIVKLTITIPIVNALQHAIERMKNAQATASLNKGTSVVTSGLSLISRFMGAAIGGGSPIANLVNAGPGALNLTGLPGRATGGPVTSGSPYIVGERGPELFIPGQTGRINSSVGGGSSVVFNNTFNLQSGDSKQNDDMMKKITNELQKQARVMVSEEIRMQKRPGGQLYGGAA